MPCPTLTFQHGECCLNMPLPGPQEAQQRGVDVTVAEQRWGQLQARLRDAQPELVEVHLMVLFRQQQEEEREQAGGRKCLEPSL